MQLKGSDITLPKYSSSTSQIRQKKDYRDKKLTWNIPNAFYFSTKNIYKHHLKIFAEEIFAIDQFWQNFAEEIFAIDQFWIFFAEEIFANKGQNRKNFFRKRFLPLR